MSQVQNTFTLSWRKGNPSTNTLLRLHCLTYFLPCLPDRPQPPSKPVVQQEDVKARSVLLSWEPGSDGLSPVRYYTIQTRELPSGRWALHSASVSHNASAFTVDR